MFFNAATPGQQPAKLSQTQERRQLQQQLLGCNSTLLASEKQKLKVREMNMTKRFTLAMSGDKLMVRSGGGFQDFFEFLGKKGFLPR